MVYQKLGLAGQQGIGHLKGIFVVTEVGLSVFTVAKSGHVIKRNSLHICHVNLPAELQKFEYV